MIVIPHYNESKRIRLDECLNLLSFKEVDLILVDDGSTDSTHDLMQGFQQQYSDRVQIIQLDQNSGKAESVRQGLLKALSIPDVKFVGYVDADFATPASEILKLIKSSYYGNSSVILGSRVHLLGRNIKRSLYRHYLGRVFATIASFALSLRVYDTQCGAKFFKASKTFEETLQTPFSSRWIFDIELIHRILKMKVYKESDFLEVPLSEWEDVVGSKLSLASMLTAGWDLFKFVLKNRVLK